MAVTAKDKRNLQRVILKLTGGAIDTAAIAQDDELLLAVVAKYKERFRLQREVNQAVIASRLNEDVVFED